jgi:two-component system response regulator PilR (NtrC family)
MPKNILVVDDDEQMRRLYSRLLAGRGHTLTLAACVQEGLTLLTGRIYDLVITDMELGDGTGSEIMEAAYGIKTILVTGSMAPEELETMAKRHNLAACFQKPFKLEALLAQINDILS